MTFPLLPVSGGEDLKNEVILAVKGTILGFTGSSMTESGVEVRKPKQ